MSDLSLLVQKLGDVLESLKNGTHNCVKTSNAFVLLLSCKLARIDILVKAFHPDKEIIPIVYSPSDSLSDLMLKISKEAPKDKSFSRVGIVSHSSKLDIVTDDDVKDQLKMLCGFLHNIYGITDLDIVSCDTANVPQFADVAKDIKLETGITVHASTNVTGPNGDWIQESPNNENLEGIYFGDEIRKYPYDLKGNREHPSSSNVNQFRFHQAFHNDLSSVQFANGRQQNSSTSARSYAYDNSIYFGPR